MLTESTNPADHPSSSITLRPYQVAAMDAWTKRRAEGLQRGIINLPTGTGKTVLGLAIAKEMNTRILWLAHRDELIEQPQVTAAVMWPDVKTGVVKASRDDVGAGLVFGSVQTLSRAARLERLTAAGGFGLVVIDEAHHSAARSYMRILEGVGAFEKQGPPVLGLTATVERGDGIRLEDSFQEVIYQLPLLAAIKAGYLADLRMKRAPINVDLDEVRSTGGDWDESALGEALLQAGVAEATAAAYMQHTAGQKALIFTVTVKQATLTAEALQRRGVPAAALSGATPTVERRSILQRLKDGETKVVVNCAVLTEGFDEPSLDAIIVARPTRSKTLYLQMIGRGTRTYPGKDSCTIVDLCGASRRHTLMQAPVLFGLDPKKVQGKTVTGALAEGYGQANLLKGVIASGAADFPRAQFHWIKVDNGLFTINVGKDHGMLLLTEGPGGDGWQIYQAKRGAAPVRLCATGAAMGLTLAQGIAEDFVRRLDVGNLATKEAPWRSTPATESQLATLRKCGIGHSQKISKGAAADLISAHFARGNVRFHKNIYL